MTDLSLTFLHIFFRRYIKSTGPHSIFGTIALSVGIQRNTITYKSASSRFRARTQERHE